MSSDFEIKKNQHFFLLSSFEKELRDSYFATEENIASSPKKEEFSMLFDRLACLITDFERADEKRKEILKNQISYLTARSPEIRNCYKQVNGKRQDLATFSLEVGSSTWLAYMANGEHREDRLAREKFYEQERRYDGHDSFEDDDLPSYQKTEKQKALLFLMHASKTHTFLPEKDIIKTFTQELGLSSHQVVGVKMDETSTFKTTPFMYFLQNHYFSETAPNVPNFSKSNFYTNANFELKNFEGDTLSSALISAGLYNVFAEYHISKEKLTDTKSATTATTSVKTINHHKKYDETPSLPGFDFERQ